MPQRAALHVGDTGAVVVHSNHNCPSTATAAPDALVMSTSKTTEPFSLPSSTPLTVAPGLAASAACPASSAVIDASDASAADSSASDWPSTSGHRVEHPDLRRPVRELNSARRPASSNDCRPPRAPTARFS